MWFTARAITCQIGVFSVFGLLLPELIFVWIPMIAKFLGITWNLTSAQRSVIIEKMPHRVALIPTPVPVGPKKGTTE